MGQPVNEASQKHGCESEDEGLAAPAPDATPTPRKGGIFKREYWQFYVVPRGGP
jgi:hypothetical protein